MRLNIAFNELDYLYVLDTKHNRQVIHLHNYVNTHIPLNWKFKKNLIIIKINLAFLLNLSIQTDIVTG